MVVGPATKCAECGDWHTYTEAGVHKMIHALIEVRDKAERSDAHPDLLFVTIAKEALLMKDVAADPEVSPDA